MHRVAFFLIPLILSAAHCFADEDLASVPFGETSKWLRGEFGEGATLVRAGRTATGIVVEGSGSGVLSTPVSYCYAAQTPNNFPRSITARLESFDGPADGSAGISIREFSPDPLSTIFMDLIYTPDGKLHRQGWTWSVDEIVGPDIIADITLPVWLQVEYVGGGLFTRWSTDGETWQDFGGDIPGTLPDEARPMLIVASGSDQGLACAHFDKVWLSGGDADDNGIHDGWEIREFGRLVGDDARRDLDGDTITVRDEWLTDGDPFVSELPRQLSVVRNGEDQVEVSLEGAPILWQLQATDSLDTPWVGIANAFGGRALILPDEGKPERFFRAVFTLPGNDPLPFELQGDG